MFGGTDPDDSSGSLKYVRVEFGGNAYITNREWNNFTFCGVGRGTVIDYIQSHKGADDAIDDGDQPYTIITIVTASSDPIYAAIDPADVAVVNRDDDTAGITVNPVAGLVTT